MEMLKKKFCLFVCLVVVSACSTIKKLPANVAGASRARFVANWSVTNISYEGLLQGAVQTIFNIAPPKDFVGSTWKLTNSGNGIITLTNGISQTVYWSYSTKNPDVFQFKKLFAGDNARKVEEGYQLTIGSIDDTQMILKLPVVLGDKTAYVVLHFVKMN